MSAEPRLTELLMQWEELRQQGQTVALEELCSDSPELLDELQRRIRALEAMDSVLAVTSSVVDGATVTAGTQADEPSGWPSVPGYEVLGVLGYGGMGVVYKVRNLAVGRIEALKMIRARLGAHPQVLQRFQMEIRAMAQFEHARIVRIYAAGQHEGQPYFTMEYVASGNLAQHMRQNAATPESAVALTIKVAQAVHYLHTKNIVHRDLKPANILLKTELGEPLVSDFGLARLFDRDIEQTGDDRPDSDPRLTQVGAVMGTAAYMSPEQAAGQTDQLTAATDVWALGVILYELLTAHRPFEGKDSESVREAVRTLEPLPPHRYRPKLGLDLEAICLRCLEKDPLRRYATAQALVDDLECVQRGEAILPESTPRRVLRGVRRHPTMATALALCGILAVVLVFLVPGYRPAEPPDTAAAAEKLAALPAKIATGRRVTLIPAVGPPTAYRWVTHDIHDTLSQEPDKPFSIHGEECTLFELLPAHTLTRYHLHVEVHHSGGSEHALVGIYFGYSKQVAANGRPLHCYCSLAFNDITTRAAQLRDQGNQMRLNVELLPQKQGAFTDAPRTRATGVSTLFRPVGAPEPESWRMLDVYVDLERIRVDWDHVQLPALPRAKLPSLANFLLANPAVRPEEEPQFLPQEALGLYVYAASAWFRSCTIEALPDGKPN